MELGVRNEELGIMNGENQKSLVNTIKDYIYFSQRPFISAQIVEETGIGYETVKKCLQGLQDEGYIKQIGTDKGKKVYIYNRHQNTAQGYKVKQKHYTLASIQEAYRRQIQKHREEIDDLL